VVPVMGSYGIGVSRLVGAAIEASHDEAGIIWPDAIAPYKLGIVNLRAGDAGCDAACAQLHDALGGDAGNALLDDTDARGGEKFARMDLIGLPWVVTVGPKGVAAGTVELKRRATGERHELSLESALAKITG
jgi:prolyl-tRNA synthetase